MFQLRNRFPVLATLLTGLLLASSVWASAPATGSITATQACDAYVSKNKRTNPGRVKLVIEQSYTVLEVNRPTNPSWYRIRVQGASPAERWVARACARGDVHIGGGTHGEQTRTCNTAGLADSYVLALSWQPAFCEIYRKKPECRIDARDAWQARNFTLHGLWPNKKECGKRYNFCGEFEDKPGHFCDYPRLDLFSAVRKELEGVMPSAAAGSCLQRHEWFKHGTCQSGWSIDDYFERSIDLVRQFNESGVAYFVSRNIGKTVSERSFFERVDCALGTGAHKRLQLRCKDGNLLDVHINLPATFGKGESLGEMIRRAEPKFGSNCGGHFRIDPIGIVN